MTLSQINEKPEFVTNEKLTKKVQLFASLVEELRKRQLSEKEIATINLEIHNINAVTGSDKAFTKVLAKSQGNILKVIEKDSNLVVKNHYRNIWLALGMTAFGLPLGVAFGLSLGNIGLLGLGLPIGMAIGIGVGTSMDAKAAKEGRQLDVQLA